MAFLIDITDEKLDLLDLQTSQAFEALKRAIEQNSFIHVHYANRIYSDIISDMIGTHILLSPDYFLGGKTDTSYPTEKLAPYIYQQVIGQNLSGPLNSSLLGGFNPRPTDKTVVDLIETIESNKSYVASGKIANELAIAHQFKEVYEVIQGIRDGHITIFK